MFASNGIQVGRQKMFFCIQVAAASRTSSQTPHHTHTHTSYQFLILLLKGGGKRKSVLTFKQDTSDSAGGL